MTSRRAFMASLVAAVIAPKKAIANLLTPPKVSFNDAFSMSFRSEADRKPGPCFIDAFGHRRDDGNWEVTYEFASPASPGAEFSTTLVIPDAQVTPEFIRDLYDRAGSFVRGESNSWGVPRQWDYEGSYSLPGV